MGKNSVKHISVKPYTYLLPEDKIAKHPLFPKYLSKLLVYKNGKIHETIFSELHAHLPHKSLLVLNNTKVVQARLIFQKETGSKIELFCLQPGENVLWEKALATKQSASMECLVGGLNKWKSGALKKQILINNKQIIVTATYLNDLISCKLIKLEWDDENITLAEILNCAGETPLPPYLNRMVEERDKTSYQTYYALNEGSVAAPTAGLHFTKEVFDTLENKNVHSLFITLHVGAGTFKPIKGAILEEHEMHKEWMCVNKEQLQTLRDCTSELIAVGTTSTRFLETLFWLGTQVHSKKITSLQNITFKQWDAYEIYNELTRQEAIDALLKKLEEENLTQFNCATQLLIAPGYTFKMIDAIITNFHQPGSTLLLLIAAAVGDDWQLIYNYALENNFRFLSYGDSSLIWLKR